MAGDTYSRIGNTLDYIQYEFGNVSDPVLPQATCDSGSNRFGDLLLEFLKHDSQWSWYS